MPDISKEKYYYEVNNSLQPLLVFTAYSFLCIILFDNTYTFVFILLSLNVKSTHQIYFCRQLCLLSHCYSKWLYRISSSEYIPIYWALPYCWKYRTFSASVENYHDIIYKIQQNLNESLCFLLQRKNSGLEKYKHRSQVR